MVTPTPPLLPMTLLRASGPREGAELAGLLTPHTVSAQECEDKSGAHSKPPSPKQSVRKSLDFEPLSTTALILEHRPA